MPRSLVDDFLDGLREVATEFVADFVEDRFTPIVPPRESRTRKNIKPPKVKTPKAPKPAKPEAQGPTLYQVLGVDAKCEPEVIEAAWKAKARLYHPDRAKGAQAAEKMKSVNAAHDVLSDPIKRREYDKQLREAK